VINSALRMPRLSGLMHEPQAKRQRLFRERFFGEPYVKISKASDRQKRESSYTEGTALVPGHAGPRCRWLSVEPTYLRATQRCALGALVSAAFQLTNDHRQAYDLAMSALRPTCGSATLVRVNDMRGYSAVLALLDEALATM
jgi:hypothetical protein